MKTLPESILEHSRRLPEGGLLSAKECSGSRVTEPRRLRSIFDYRKIEHWPIRHALHWMIALGSTTAGAVIRALAWLGERRIGEVTEALRKRLTPIDWHALSSVRSVLPSWMALAIGREVG